MDMQSDGFVLTMWDEFTIVQGSELGKILATRTYPLIFAKRVALTSFQGISLTTRFDTSIEINPTTSQARTLREWSSSNTTLIEKLLEQEQHRDALAQFVPPNSFIKSGTRDVTTSDDQEQIFWIEGHIKILEDGLIPYYIGCNTCNKKVIYIEGITFNCMHCGNKNANTTKRFRLSAEITDQIGALPFTLFTHDFHKLLRLLQTNTPIERLNCSDLNEQLAPIRVITAIKIMPPNYQTRNGKIYALQCFHSLATTESTAFEASTSKRNLIDECQVGADQEDKKQNTH